VALPHVVNGPHVCTACYIYVVPDRDVSPHPVASSRATRVLELLGPSTGGIRAHVAELTRRLATRGWGVVVAGPDGVMDGVGEQDAVVAVPAGWNPLALRRARTQLRVRLGAEPFDVLHAHGLKAALVALGVRPRPPLVLTVHNLVGGTAAGMKARVLGRVERSILRRADHVVVISDEIAAHLTGLVPAERQTFVLPVSPRRSPGRAVDEVRAEYGVGADTPLVVVVARHHPQKDLAMFLRAMVRVRAAVPGVRAVMVGDGPERAHLEAECTRLGLADVVAFAGFRPNPADEMQAADVVALSSRWEGSPLVVAECLALGRPLVTTAVGTVARHLVDGVSARVVPVGDDAAFAAALVELLGDPDRAAAIGAAGQAVATSTFDPDRLVESVEQVYRRVTPAAVAR
jgi:glycosyltransferase involved in cell wall biosynthesis